MIIQTFNLPYCLMFAFFTALTVFLCLFLNKKGPNYSRKFLTVLYCGAIVLYFVYKGFVITDKEYCALMEYQRPYFLNELPFNTCNVLLFLLPVAVWSKKKGLLSCIASFSVFTGILAILMPSKGFNGYPVMLPRIWGYFITHFLVMMETPLLISSGVYKPEYKDVPKSVLILLLMAFIAFIISVILAKTGLNPRANYFYSRGPEGNPVLGLFYKLIPVNGLYLIPTSVLAFGMAYLVVWISKLTSKKN